MSALRKSWICVVAIWLLLVGAVAEETQTSWRDEYKLGAGDVVNIRYYGRPELDREGVRIAPDGSLSYLQVNSLAVAGLSLDGARQALETALRAYYRNARLIVTPEELVSKRYVILGKVVDKGIFTLERPLTLLEAIARSRGIETGLYEQNTVELADLERSFIVRGGERLPVDMAALYYEGDLSQNIEIEPDDYIFLASNIANEYYVLGAVRRPGAQGYSAGVTVVGAIARREGFLESAWQKRVLLVRGSLERPEAQIVDVEAILAGQAVDVPIEPGDILYINDRPWYRVEQLLDRALQGFVQSATTTWVSSNVPDAIRAPFIPQTGWRE